MAKPLPKKFAGLRTVTALSAIAALPASIAAITLLVLTSISEREDPWRELEERARAGALALNSADPRERESALVAVAAPIRRGEKMSDRTWMLALFASGGFALFLAGFWVSHRLSSPLDGALDSADRWLAGDRAARPDVQKGGREARAVARTIQVLIEEADRREAHAGAQLEPALAAIAADLSALGKGELSRDTIEAPPILAPLARTLGETRRALADRLSAIERSSAEISIGAAGILQGARRLAASGAEAAESIDRVVRDASAAHDEVRANAATMTRALDGLANNTAAHRRLALQLKADVGVASRRTEELRAIAEGVDRQLQGATALDEALDLLATIASSGETVAMRGGGSIPSAQVSMSVRRARTALETLRGEMRAVEQAAGEVTDGLASVVVSAPPPAGELEPAIGAALQSGAMSLVKSAERLLEAVRAIERAAKMVETSAGQIAVGADIALQHGPRVASAMSVVELGEALDRDLLDRLERARAAYGERDDEGLSDVGRDMIGDLQRGADEARARLARLIAVTEAAAELMRDARSV